MFSQAKDLYKMQQQAKKMQKKMKDVTVTGMSKNELVSIDVNGVNEIAQIDIDPELLEEGKKALLEKSIIQAYKDGSKKLQKQLAKDMDLDQMKSMLGM